MSAKPRVVILSTFLTPFRSGAEACAEEVPLRLCDRYDITIVTARLRRSLPKEDLLQGKVPVQRVGFGFPFDKWIFPFLSPFAAKKLHPEIIHAILETFAGLALHFCKFLVPSARRILTLQTTNRSFLKGMIVRSPHHVTAISTALIALAQGLGRADVALIPNGVDLSAIPTMEKVPGRILFVGRLEKWKGVDVLLRAFALLGNPSTHLRIVGEGSERAPLERLTRDLKIEDRVTFVGQLAHLAVYQEFAEAEIFCGPSRSEALGNVFLEAQAAGCAVIGTRIGGIVDSIQDGVTGLLVKVDDVGEAAGALEKLLEKEGMRQSLSEAGKRNALQYDWSIIAEKYSRVYELVLSG